MAEMSRAQELAKRATDAAAFRGHLMQTWTWHEHSGDRITGSSYCNTCGRGAFITTKPAPNEIDISGEAVALNCRE